MYASVCAERGLKCLHCSFLVVFVGEKRLSYVAVCLNKECPQNIQNMANKIDYPILRCLGCGGSTTLRRGVLSPRHRWCLNCSIDVDIPVAIIRYLSEGNMFKG